MTATHTRVTTRTGSRTGPAPGEGIGLPERPSGRTTGWWGMVLFICTESATFAAAIASYFYLRFGHPGPWPPSADKLPHLLVPGIGTAMLVLSCVPMALAVRVAARPRRLGTGLALLLALGGGIAFVVLQLVDYAAEWPSSTLSKDAYGSLFYTITGLHVAHVVLGLLMVGLLTAAVSLGRAGGGRDGSVRIVAMYWYFLSVLALAVYATVYLSPYL